MRFRSARWSFAVLGFLLGAGAPVGAVALRALLPGADATALFYGYMLVGTSLVFAAAGFAAGMYAERVQKAEAFYQRLSELDPLTGFYNPRALGNFYRRAIEHAARRHEPLALLLVDVDGLKAINDHFGHPVGNEALLHVANAIRDAKRVEDVAARWGGDEFVVLLELADESAARRVAEKILHLLRATPLTTDGGPIDVTATIGACVGSEIAESDDLLNIADRALYRGKQAGRDRLSIERIGSAVASTR